MTGDRSEPVDLPADMTSLVAAVHEHAAENLALVRTWLPADHPRASE